MREPTPHEWETILQSVSDGSLPVPDALEQLGALGAGELHLDHDRERRCGAPEVVYGAGKTPEQIAMALRSIHQRSGRALATRVDREVGASVAERISGAEWFERSGVIRIADDRPLVGEVAVVVAGTSDLPVAEEAQLTAEFCGSTVTMASDVGVAGLHRILSARATIERARAVIVVAGMEGALPSVVGGLVSAPVIAVPTSVGYGASFGGVAALLGMLNSCAPGISVVNIDNGFGAGLIADRINRQKPFEEASR